MTETRQLKSVLWRPMALMRGDLGSSCVSEEIRARRRDSSARNRRGQATPEAIEGGVTIKSDKLVRGSGNVFRDLGIENADVLQLQSILAGEIIKTLDREGLTVRAAQVRTGMAAADFSRIRKADLGRFTVDRLMTVISRLGSRVDVTVTVRRPRAAA
jgi:predicted XRE-type DNA-binding protein